VTATAEVAHDEPVWHKIVIRFATQVIRAYLSSHTYGTIQELSHSISQGPPKTLQIRRHGSDQIEEINVEDAKAVFHVNSFDGDRRRRDLRFHTHAPIIHGIWMRLEFYDGEVMEGITQNTIHYIVNPGILLYPTDPGSNNQLAYVMKRHLKDVQILGLRTPPSAEDGRAVPFVHLCKPRTA